MTIVEPNDTILEANDTGLTSDNPGNFVVEGFIGDSPDDVDLFQVQLDVGDRLTIDIDARINGSSLDSILRLFDSEGNQVAVNDDFGSLDSFISFDPSVSDIYYIGVSSFSNFDYNPFVAGSGTGSSTGEYNIDINLIPVIDGTEDDDLLIGTPNKDRIYGFAGNDTIDGGLGDDLIVGQEGNDNLTGGGNRDKFAIALGEGTDTVTDFGRVGTGVNPPQAVIDEVDTLQFFGDRLTAENMFLTQKESDLEITFEGVDNTKVILKDFKLQDLDNLTEETGASVTIGNILFDGQQKIQDSFDVFDAEPIRSRVFNRNTVTFLNDLDNTTQGFENSNDVINGQGGNDILLGRSGNDLLRGNDGDDILLDGGAGDDRLDGGAGNDGLFGGAGADRFVLRAGDGTDTIFDFKYGNDSLLLADGLEFEQLEINSSNGDTLISITDTGELLASLIGVDVNDITMDDFTTLV